MSGDAFYTIVLVENQVVGFIFLKAAPTIRGHTTPWESIASATLRNPAMFAPAT